MGMGMGRGMGGPGQILPGFIVEQLKLTDKQKEQLAALQKETDARVRQLERGALAKLRETIDAC